ncbi:ATP-binding protein [Curtobacterium sp. MCPF17_052]|uniref:ATP-binding protein n=1 Tax=Curtobacterium sp. MCPF17_052 TaxID=2175655 RepID=UPI0024DFD43F|nr:ATP-binding protein [Curtobacterium sp. MCPF17_052]WIB13975.1 ATP-binding protein [Curtobacterium sp. MCPF17_052]
MQDTFAAWWDGQGIDDPTMRFRLETALVEVAANVIEHTRRSDTQEGRRFVLDLTTRDTELVAVLSDNGMPADIDLSAVTMADPEDEGGRGLALAIAALDRLDHHHEGGRNVWVLVCAR